MSEEAQKAASQLGSLAASVGSVLLSKEALGFLEVLAHASATLPLVGPVGSLIQQVMAAARVATFNKQAANALALRAREVGEAVAELVQLLPAGPGQCPPSMELELGRLKGLLESANAFMSKFSKRNYLSRVIRGSSDADSVRQLDKELTDVVSSMQVSLGIRNMSLQMRALSELDDVKKLIDAHGGLGSISTNPSAAAAVASQIGVSGEDFQAELQAALSDIVASQSRIEHQLDDLANKLDALISK